MSSQRFPLIDALSVLFGIRLSSDQYQVHSLVEFLTGRATAARSLEENTRRARYELVRQCLLLEGDAVVLAHAALRRALLTQNGGGRTSTIRTWAEKAAGTLGMEEIELSSPFLPDLAYQIIRTISSGVHHENELKCHPNLDGYLSPATATCIQRMIQDEVIKERRGQLYLASETP